MTAAVRVADLQSIAERLGDIPDVDTLARRCHAILEDVADAEYTGIYLYDLSLRHLRLHCAKGFSEKERRHAEETAWERHPGWVVRNRRMLHVPDAQRNHQPATKSSARSFEVRSRLYLPVIAGQKCVGAFGIAGSRAHQFSDEHIAVLRFVTSVAGLAFHQLSSRSQLETANQRLREGNELLVASKQRAERLRHEAESANAAKAEFLAMMSHEMRTPLGAMIGLGDLIAETRLDHDQADLLRRLRGNADLLLHHIDDILDFSRLEAGSIQLRESFFDPVDLFDDVAVAMAGAVPQGVELTFDVARNVPRQLWGDVRRVRQVLLNLVSNALKFTHRGHVEVRAVAEGEDDDGVRVRYEVSDTGPGVATAERQRIFDRFVRGEGQRPEAARGTGLGLAICRSLASLMGGEVGLADSDAVGSTFFLRLPHTVESGTANASGVELSRRHALVCAPSEALRRSLRSVLQQWGAAVIECSQLSDALRDNLLSSCELLLVDADGLTSDDRAQLERIARERGERLIVIGCAEPSRCLQLARQHGCATTSKPVRRRALADALRHACAAKRRRQPKQTPATPPRHTHARRILLAEDDQDSAFVVRRVLEARGVCVDIAPPGTEAYELATSRAYDLILTDYSMPGLTGAELTAAYRRWEHERRLPRIPIALLSAYALPHYREQALHAGADEFLLKPIRTDELSRSLRRLFDPRPMVLVVCGDGERRALLRRQLDGHACVRVHVVDDERAALEVQAVRGVALLLLDVDASKELGADVIELTRRANALGSQVAALLHPDDRRAQEDAKAAGIVEHIDRSAPASTLAHSIEQLLMADSAPRASERIEVDVDDCLLDLIPAYLERRRADVDELRALLQAGDLRRASRIGHDMKGTGSGYGFAAISEIGAVIERSARAGNRVELDGACRRLAQYLQRVHVRSSA
jgi:signal transduction histidine kinase/CheY-like chemotaxis protein